jgi:hypothetical protein
MAAVTVPPIPRREVLIWIYRESPTFRKASIRPKGRHRANFSYAQANGGTFSHDFPPGHYHVTAQSWGIDLSHLPTLISLPAVRIASKSSRYAVGRPMATEVILGGCALLGARSKSPVPRSPTAHSVAAADRRPKLARSSWSTLLHRLLRAGAPLFLLAIADGCAPMPPTTASVTVPLVRPGEARVWFYRGYEPYAGKGRPSVAINGTYAGIAELGGAFYRDVPPGHYLATVETYGIDFNQVANFDLAPGQEAYVKIVSSPSWYEDGDKRAFERPTYYAWLIAGNIARADITHLAFYGGS